MILVHSGDNFPLDKMEILCICLNQIYFRKDSLARRKYALVDAIQKTENILHCLARVSPWLAKILDTSITSSDTCNFRVQVLWSIIYCILDFSQYFVCKIYLEMDDKKSRCQHFIHLKGKDNRIEKIRCPKEVYDKACNTVKKRSRPKRGNSGNDEIQNIFQRIEKIEEVLGIGINWILNGFILKNKVYNNGFW